MERRVFVAGVLGLLTVPLAVEAQPAGKAPRIGFLALNPGANPHLREAFLQGLRALGYVEGRNVVIDYRDAEGKLERLPALATELVALKVDVIVTAGGTPTALAAKQATKTLRLRTSSSPALRARAAMSRGCPTSPRSSSASVSTISRRPCRKSVWSRSSATRFGRRTHGHAEGSRARGAATGGAAWIA